MLLLQQRLPLDRRWCQVVHRTYTTPPSDFGLAFGFVDEFKRPIVFDNFAIFTLLVSTEAILLYI